MSVAEIAGRRGRMDRPSRTEKPSWSAAVSGEGNDRPAPPRTRYFAVEKKEEEEATVGLAFP